MNELTSSSLADDLSRYIQTGDSSDFEAMALRIFAHQFTHNRPYQAFCNGRKQTPDTVRHWQDIPAAPASAFKRFALTCTNPELCTIEEGGRTFHSSGTTGSETSRHFMDSDALRCYRHSLQASFPTFLLDDQNLPVIGLLPPPDQSPHSSLSFMVGDLIHRYTGQFFWGEEWHANFLDTTMQTSEPACFFGTAFAWVQLIDHMLERSITLTLPEGSRIIETGGFKGRSREVSRDELYTLFTRCFGVPASHLVAEYGMSEMASQYYDTTYRDFVGGIAREPRKAAMPHLLRTRVIDPVTGHEVNNGIPGLLTHYDLANLNSCLAIQTEDWGFKTDDGTGIVLLGRAPGAALRGCSLTAEEFAARQNNR